MGRRKWAVPIVNKYQLEIPDFAFSDNSRQEREETANCTILYAKIGLIKDINQLYTMEEVLWKKML